MANQWFRLYAEFATDPVVQSLDFADQRHYIVILCLKCQGVLDRNINAHNRTRVILRGLGLDYESANEVRNRLMDVGLIEKNWQPIGWDKRQFVSDNSTSRVRNYRKNKEVGNVSEALPQRSRNAPETDTETDIEKEKDVSKETSKKKSFSHRDMPELSEQTAADLIAHRKAKGAPMSATVWTKALVEFEKAGLSPEDGAQEWIARGWQGFKSSWLENEKTRTAGQHGSGSTGTNQRGNYEPPIDPITRRLRELKRASSGNTPVDAIEGNFSIDLAATWDAARSGRSSRN